MPSRYKSRQTALQILYLRDMRSESLPDLITSYYGSLASEEGEPTSDRDQFAEELVHGTISRVEEIDQQIVLSAKDWRIERMPIVDRNILRLAIYELMALPTPTPVVIDQALDLAAKFSAPESVSFLNGVLDSISQRVRGERGLAAT
jgi:N utilization substance protein B